MTGTPNGAEVVGSAGPAPDVELKAREMAATEHSTTGKWSEVTSGDVLTLQRGFDLPKAKRKPGSHPVIASTGPVGTHNEAMVEGPGVVIGRSGSLGSGVSTLNRNHVHPLPVSLPPLSEQRAIAHILGTLDAKIELNRRMNETLEEVARAILKDWFIDFGPTHAKMEGRWRRGESLPGLPDDLYDIFPGQLVDSELGGIPEGWEVKPLGDCINVARGLSYKGSGLSSNGVPIHNLNSIYEGGGYKHLGIKYYDGDYRPRHLTVAGDVIVANAEQGHNRLLIGYAAIVPLRYGSGGLFILTHRSYRHRCITFTGI